MDKNGEETTEGREGKGMKENGIKMDKEWIKMEKKQQWVYHRIGTCKECAFWRGTEHNLGDCIKMYHTNKIANTILVLIVPADFGCIYWEKRK